MLAEFWFEKLFLNYFQKYPQVNNKFLLISAFVNVYSKCDSKFLFISKSRKVIWTYIETRLFLFSCILSSIKESLCSNVCFGMKSQFFFINSRIFNSRSTFIYARVHFCFQLELLNFYPILR